MAPVSWLRGILRLMARRARPRFRLIVGAAPETVCVIRERIVRLHGRCAVIVVGYERLTSADFGCDCFREIDLIPTSSDAEEEIYREAAQHRDQVAEQLREMTYRDVQIAPDFQRSVMPPAERMLQIARATQVLFSRGYDTVTVVVEGYTLYHQCLVAEARACQLMAPAEGALKVVNGGLEPAAEFNARTTGDTANWRSALRLPAQRPIADSEVLVFALTASKVYLRNGAEVMHALARGSGTRAEVFCETPAQQEAVAAFGVPSALIGYDFESSDSDAIVATGDAFIEAWRADAQARMRSHGRLSFTDFGRHTLDALDSVMFTFEDAVAGLIRTLARIEALDEIIRSRPKAVIYKVPHVSTTCDHMLLALARRHERRHVASVYLSVSDTYRNLDYAKQDVLTTLGDRQSEIMKRLGLAREVISAGQPEMDAIDRDWTEERSWDYVAAAVPELAGRKLVTVATSGFDLEGELEWTEALIQRCSERGDCFVVIKLHPSSPDERHRQRFSRTGQPVAIVRDAELVPYIRAASTIATDVSHAGKIAVYMNRPLLVANVSGRPYPYHRFEEDGVARLASETEGIAALLDEALDLPGLNPAAREAFIRREFTSDDGKAADRIAEVLRRLHRP